MKFLTGDDTGIMKVVHVEAKKLDKFGTHQQGDGVDQLCWAGPAESREGRVAVARASGLLELRDATTGATLVSTKVAPSVRCLAVTGNNLLAVSQDGEASVVKGWCTDAPAGSGADGAAEEVETTSFKLQAPVAGAALDPTRPDRFAFGGRDNDVKVFDLEKGDVSWRAKNVRENSLCLAVPVRVSSLQWATTLAGSRSLIICGTSDGKIRLYDVKAQRRPVFEMPLEHGTCGYTGTTDDQPRPITASLVAPVRGDAWSFFCGTTMGVLREFDLRHLPSISFSPAPPGRKAHIKWARTQMPAKRGYPGVMGSIRGLDVHASGEVLVSVGLGRFAYVFETGRKNMETKVFLKQKLNCVLFSSEERTYAGAGKDDDDKSGEEGPGGKGTEDGDGDDGSDDAVSEGFSDDEGNAEDAGEEEDDADAPDDEEDSEAADEDGGAGGDEDSDIDLPEASAPSSKRRRKPMERKGASAGEDEAEAAAEEAPTQEAPSRRKRRHATGATKGTPGSLVQTDAPPKDESCPPPGRKRKKK